MKELTRRQLLQGSAAVAVAGTAGVFVSPHARLARAAQKIAEKPSGEPIVIGHQCELTGWDAATGYWRNKAATGLVEWLNNNGGIAGRPIELITVDTKSDVDVGVNQMRELLLDHDVDIIIGSEMTSIALASNKLAQEHETLYMTMSTGEKTTSKDHAVPFQFRMTGNSALEAMGASQFMVNEVGKRWTVLYVDYAWGQSERDWWTRGVEAAGGEVVSPVAVPLDAQDMFPYIGRLDRSVDGIYIPVLNTLQAIQTIRDAGLKQQIVLAGLSFSLFDYRDLGDTGEGVWGIELAPLELADLDSEHMRNTYEILGIGADGVEAESGKVAGASMIVGISQTLGFLKANIEGSGWKSRSDTPDLIKHAEGIASYEQGPLFPVAEVEVRPEDHQAFMDIFLVRIAGGRLQKRGRIPKEQTKYPADANLLDR